MHEDSNERRREPKPLEIIHALAIELRKLRLREDNENQTILWRIETKVGNIMASQAEGTIKLEGALAKLTKIGNETRTLLTRVTALQEQLANLPEVGPALQKAIDDVDSQATVVDDLVPEEVTPPVEPPAE